MKKIIGILAFALCAFACGDSESDPEINTVLPAIAEFGLSFASVDEGQEAVIITVGLHKPAPEDGTIQISINNISSEYNSDYTVAPFESEDMITLDVEKNDTNASFTVNLLDDDDQDEEQVQFTMVSTSGGVRLANKNILLLTIIDEDIEVEPDPKYAACLDPLKSDELDVVTWNIEFFPMRSTTKALVTEIIESTDTDVIAVQEINDIGEFNSLANGLLGWEGQIINLSGSLDIGYLYKTSEVTVVSNAAAVLTGSVEPRPPVEITIKHTNGMEVTLLNIHLKCCGGQSNIDRRAAASVAIKNYIDQNLSGNNVIVLGDFNDDINSDSPFNNFINDSDNYEFADAEIASGSSSNWSYPSWPSHLDHILITNELMDNLVNVKTLRLNQCLSNYISTVSDHRPVMATFK